MSADRVAQRPAKGRYITGKECYSKYKVPASTPRYYAIRGGPHLPHKIRWRWTKRMVPHWRAGKRPAKMREYLEADVAELASRLRGCHVIDYDGAQWWPVGTIMRYTGLANSAAQAVLSGRMPKYLSLKWNRVLRGRTPRVEEIADHELPFVGGSVRALRAEDGRAIARLLGRKPRDNAPRYVPPPWKNPRTGDRDKFGYELFRQRVAPQEIMKRLSDEAENHN